jgi:hypothetical protein
MCSATCLAAWVLQDEGHLGHHILFQQQVVQPEFVLHHDEHEC